LQEQIKNGIGKNNDGVLKHGENDDRAEKGGQKDVGVQPQFPKI
jgi:hypothetical protein